jgi:multicomponent K+:H+ antiporter subunit C
VLTAIVISFGMTALIVVLALRAYLEAGSDAVDTEEATVEPAASHDTRQGLPRDGDAA